MLRFTSFACLLDRLSVFVVAAVAVVFFVLFCFVFCHSFGFWSVIMVRNRAVEVIRYLKYQFEKYCNTSSTFYVEFS